MTDIHGYIAAHERLAVLAVEASDRNGDDVMAQIVDRADDVTLLLSLAIAFAEERAQRHTVRDAEIVQRPKAEDPEKFDRIAAELSSLPSSPG